MHARCAQFVTSRTLSGSRQPRNPQKRTRAVQSSSLAKWRSHLRAATVQHGVVRAGKFPVLTKLSRAPRMGGCVPTWYAALQIMVLRQQACVQHMASRCTHQQKHASIAGVQASSGQYLSTLTAEYPASLAASLIKHCAFKVSTQPEIRRLSKPSPLSLHPVRLRVCDGAGMHSTADHSIPQPNHPLTIVAWAPATHPLLSRNSIPKRQLEQHSAP